MKKYYFVFHKGDIMLERLDNGCYTIPMREEPPTETTPSMASTFIMFVCGVVSVGGSSLIGIV